MDVSFPVCGKLWNYNVKGHTNHPTADKANMFGIVSLTIVRDPRDAIVAYFRSQLTSEYSFKGVPPEAVIAKVFSTHFGPMLTYMTKNYKSAKAAKGYVLFYEELHSSPLRELRKLSEIMGLDPSENLLREVFRGSSFIVEGKDGDLRVVEALERKTAGRSEDVYCKVGEYKTEPLFEGFLETAEQMMKDSLSPDLIEYYLAKRQ